MYPVDVLPEMRIAAVELRTEITMEYLMLGPAMVRVVFECGVDD